MTRRAAALVAVAAALVGGACAPRYTGGARALSPATLAHEPGWSQVPTPAVRQRTEADCGAAALAMTVARWRPTLDVDAITRARPVPPGGLRLGDLRDLARAAGLAAFAVAGDQALLRYELGRGRAVVVGLYRPYGARAVAHYEVVVGVHADGRVATRDPADAGLRVRTWAALRAEWLPAGAPALVVLGDAVTTAVAGSP
ncbi:MAG: cysteine peptidase family C39 domain-containing protein [Kofleriaceae bacterium]